MKGIEKIKKYIYKITNNVNGKIYIGQTKDINKRWKDHMKYKTSTSKELKKDVEKFGVLSFSLDILEPLTLDYNEKEIFYISEYRKNGYELYNIADGGENPPLMLGLEHPLCKLSKKQVEEIKDFLKYTYFSNKEISEMCECTLDQIGHINNGTSWYDKNSNYPLRKILWGEYIGNKIINDLLSTKLTQKEISKKYNVARSMVTMINIGENQKRENISYPIRKGKVTKK